MSVNTDEMIEMFEEPELALVATKIGVLLEDIVKNGVTLDAYTQLARWCALVGLDPEYMLSKAEQLL